MPNVLTFDKAPAPLRKASISPATPSFKAHGNALLSRKSPQCSSRTISAFHQHICYHELNMMWEDMILKCLASLNMGEYQSYFVSLVFISLCHQDTKFLKGRELQWYHVLWSSLLGSVKHMLGSVKVIQGYVGLLVQMISELDWLATALAKGASFTSGRAVSRTFMWSTARW